MRRILLFLFVAMSAMPLAAQEMRYVGDEVVLVLRERPSADAPARGSVASGARVQVLEIDRGSGYARVRTGENREGWILARFLTTEPVAREKLQRVEKDLAAAQAELRKVKEDHARLLQDFSRVSGGAPLATRERIAETERLRAELARREAEVAELRRTSDVARTSQRTLAVGGGLVAAGMLLALLLRWLWPKRRWRDF